MVEWWVQMHSSVMSCGTRRLDPHSRVSHTRRPLDPGVALWKNINIRYVPWRGGHLLDSLLRRTPSTVLYALKPWHIPRLFTTVISMTRTSKFWCSLPVCPLTKSIISAAVWLLIMFGCPRPRRIVLRASQRSPRGLRQ
ncbi:hypothetical protein PISMIDRAFT_189783 [Pisolithus microcarpus 441]|uniref:Uncharacterized protein n=1 Tax=Pisolithus microcarpus 441 TaxID=765257 RepID=A0A0C9Z7Y9_9AGAM|nr:hypothetical protein BKA83DRAFT_189783 [Pisolithus microcarpus]KIK18482.1 hypothetical protein PISMIDRAFT_189783 [Pisolithus microcarpus 441]